MMVLALDTATAFASIALYDGEQVLAELSWRSHRRHTIELAPQVENLCRLAEVAPAAITVIAVAIGPGSYTGTRIALSFAKGIIATSQQALIAIPTLDVLAYPHTSGDRPLCALVAAGRGRYCWTTYAANTEIPQRQRDWGLHQLQELLGQIDPPMRFVGELSSHDQGVLSQAWGKGAIILPPAQSVRRAGMLAELAWKRWRSGHRDDANTLSPIYLASPAST